jgi:VWFA-related protein
VNGTEQEAETVEPFDTGLVERTGITLMFLDVEVTDDEGRPIPGLKPDDFEVQINGRFQSVYSVDDLCSCAGQGTSAMAESAVGGVAKPPLDGHAGEGALAPPLGASPAPANEAMRYVLYFDFGQLQQDGRARAIDAARRWIRESLTPESQTMLVAYASAPGLRTLVPFTADRAELLAAIEAASTDPEWLDPFPSMFWRRTGACDECCLRERCPDCGNTCCASVCLVNARDDYQHGRRSLKALKAFLGELENTPGPKTLLLFHQNGSIFPSRFYPVRDIGDHVALLDSVGAEATLARAAVYSAYSGSFNRLESPVADQAVTLGANLAEFTGGKYNRGNTDFESLIEDAIRGCRCVYRIGLRAPRKYKGRVFRVKVWAGGRPLDYRYRTQYLDEVDRWWRRARGVLANPGNATDVGVTAALVPQGLSEKGWQLEVQVGVDVDTLALFPAAGKQRGDWEVGAFLYRDDGRSKREMLGRSRVLLGPEGRPEAIVLHERDLDSLKPGTYHLAAFVRDRAANVFGGAEATLTLPKRNTPGMVGPIMMRAGGQFVSSPLPLLAEKGDAAIRSSTVQTGTIPIGRGSVSQGTPVQIVTWLCAGGDLRRQPTLLRFVSKDGTAPVPTRSPRSRSRGALL